MKYLKIYENYTDELKEGDYITYKVDCSDNGKILIRKNHPYKVIKVDKYDKKFRIMCDDGMGILISLENNDYYKKISEEEALILLDAEKYNL